MPTSADVATRRSAAKSCSQNPCLPQVSITAAPTGRTLQTTSSLSLRTWACPTATYSVKCVRTSDASATTSPATASSSPHTRTRSKRYVPKHQLPQSHNLILTFRGRSKTKICGTRASSIPFCTPTSTSSAASCSRTSALRVMATWVLMGLVKYRTESRAGLCILFYISEGVLRVLGDWYMTGMGIRGCISGQFFQGEISTDGKGN